MTTIDALQDQRITEIRPLIPPLQVTEELPLSPDQQAVVARGREAVTSVLDGRDDRLLVIVGPCSVHDPVAALEYAQGLSDLADRLASDILVVMRVYFEKPRTTVGWKGLINDPGMDETFRVNDGLVAARTLLSEVLSLGLPAGCEFLDPITPQYIADTVSWGAIGARTTQSQIHRQMASGLSMPIGFKNLTEGDVQGAVDAVAAAAGAQAFPGITEDGRAALFVTSGNPDCHVVLRGGSDGPNYQEEKVAEVLDRLERARLARRVVIDASHANSGKDHRRQPVVVADVVERIARGNRAVIGLMLESFLKEGRQDLEFGRADQLVYGQSITDACLGWEQTATILEDIARAVAKRRALVVQGRSRA